MSSHDDGSAGPAGPKVINTSQVQVSPSKLIFSDAVTRASISIKNFNTFPIYMEVLSNASNLYSAQFKKGKLEPNSTFSMEVAYKKQRRTPQTDAVKQHQLLFKFNNPEHEFSWKKHILCEVCEPNSAEISAKMEMNASFTREPPSIAPLSRKVPQNQQTKGSNQPSSPNTSEITPQIEDKDSKDSEISTSPASPKPSHIMPLKGILKNKSSTPTKEPKVTQSPLSDYPDNETAKSGTKSERTSTVSMRRRIELGMPAGKAFFSFCAFFICGLLIITVPAIAQKTPMKNVTMLTFSYIVGLIVMYVFMKITNAPPEEETQTHTKQE